MLSLENVPGSEGWNQRSQQEIGLLVIKLMRFYSKMWSEPSLTRATLVDQTQLHQNGQATAGVVSTSAMGDAKLSMAA